jgi:hypothetical protein|nr:MAG: hypothetical protein [Bacteriophage sp.]DAK79009.1 MAG TPA: hypothetical protein [Caudoviricetes sp.]
MREQQRTRAYQLYTADMLYLCAVSLGQPVEKPFSEIMAEYDKPLSERRHETTLEEAQECWEKTLADSKKAAEQNGGGGI